MQLQITLCGLCCQSRPEITRTIARLEREYPDLIRVVKLRCMAACDEVPAVMIDTDFCPRITAEELYERVVEQLELAQTSDE